MKQKVPKFDGTSYATWKKLVVLWTSVTDIEKEKQGAYLVMNMSGKALEIALNEDNSSVDNLIKKLDEVYGESNDLWTKYEEFDNLKRDKDQPMKEFALIFEQKVLELQTAKLTIPDVVLSYKLLKGANLSQGDEKIARATCVKMELAQTKEALLRLTDTLVKSTKEDFVKVKQEPSDDSFTFFAERNCECTCHNPDQIFYQNNQRRMQRPASRFNRDQVASYTNNRQCYGCGDSSHWIRDCPHVMHNMHNTNGRWQNRNSRYDNNSNFQSSTRGKQPYNFKRTYNVNTESEDIQDEHNHDILYNYNEGEETRFEKPIFYQSNVGNESEEILLVGETLNKAVLDCGASRTVCGVDWYTCYIDSLDDEALKEVVETPSDTVFKFCPGSPRESQLCI